MSATPDKVRPQPSCKAGEPTRADLLLQQLGLTVWQGAAGEAPLNACFCALLSALDPKAGLDGVIECLPRDELPFDLLGLLNATANYGYLSQTAKLRLSDIEKRLLPCLFLPIERGRPREDQAMVLLGVTDDADGDRLLSVYDGTAKTLIKLESDDPLALRLGRAYFFKAYREDLDPSSKAARQASGRSWFSAVLGRFRSLLMQIMGIGLLLNMMALSTPIFIMMVYDRVIASQSTETLSFLVIGVLIAIATEAILRSIRSKSLAWLAARLDTIVNNTTFAQLVGLPPAAVERASVSSQIARIKTFESVRDFFSGSVFLSFLELPFVVVALLALAWIAGPLAVVPVIAAGLYGLTFFLLLGRVRNEMRHAAKASSARHRFVIETFEKIEGVRANGLTDRWAAMFRELSGRECVNSFKLYFLGVIGETAGHAISLLAATTTLGFGVFLVRDGAVTTGALVAAMILVWRILSPFQSLCMIVPRLEQLKNSIIQVNNLMDLEGESAANSSGGTLRKIKGHLAFQHVGFRYTLGQDALLGDLSFEARPGELVVITGSNGTGKSSVLKLARGLYQPQSGTVRLDGFDLRQLDMVRLRRQIAYVPQHPDLFSGSIADNLRLLAPAASDGELWQALEMLDAAAEVAALDGQLAAEIGQNRWMMSSALPFRLSLARAFLQDARVMVIDELPNSLLNGAAGQTLKSLLIRQRGQRTILLAAHRADLLRLADKIALLRHGAPASVGPPDMIFGLMAAA
ncbi:MAG: peptidase domain-containing ABC transporter [Alphaproteobacteria bacterium]